MTVYLLQYNNYYNRLVKTEDTLEAYQQYIVNTLQSTNFKPNDYVNAEIIIALTGDIKNNWVNGDYVLVCEDNEIVSRWFVVESVRLSNAQHRLQLRRDVIADYFNIIKDSPMFVEKAMLDSGNPLIFNNENMSYNQIKIYQEDLYDDSNTPWIAMYVGLDAIKNAQGEYVDTTFTFTTTNVDTAIDKDDLDGYDGLVYMNDAELAIEEKLYDKGWKYRFTKYWASGQYNVGRKDINISSLEVTEQNRQTIASIVRSYSFDDYLSNKVDNANLYNGTIVKDSSTGKYYKAIVRQTPTTIVTRFYWSSALGVDILNAIGKTSPGDSIDNTVSIAVIEQRVEFQEVTAYTSNLTFTIHSNTVYCNEAPYYLLYMPYNAQNLNMAIGIAKSLGAYCYDIQVVPYCPEERNRRPYPEEGDDNTTLPIYNTNHIVGYIYSAASNSFSFSIEYNGLYNKSADTALELKVQNETQFARFNSPNGQGTFEMSIAKNYGIGYINVECTYKPVMPYINVCPVFKGMYGSNYKDYRGLICQGDFSIPLVNDAWVAYEQNNKNYQNIFDREIESMELKNKVGMAQDITGAITGTLQGAGAGAMVGGMYGAIAGGVGAAAAGVADVAINQMLRTDALDLTKDQFGYQLGNIKARPNTLSKTGSISIDNHYVPYIEIYDCTDKEKEALRNKIKYNGMTVGVIGTLSEYLTNDYTYIKGKLIRLEDVYDDTHLINTIADELYKGVYVK